MSSVDSDLAANIIQDTDGGAICQPVYQVIPEFWHSAKCPLSTLQRLSLRTQVAADLPANLDGDQSGRQSRRRPIWPPI